MTGPLVIIAILFVTGLYGLLREHVSDRGRWTAGGLLTAALLLIAWFFGGRPSVAAAESASWGWNLLFWMLGAAAITCAVVTVVAQAVVRQVCAFGGLTVATALVSLLLGDWFIALILGLIGSAATALWRLWLRRRVSWPPDQLLHVREPGMASLAGVLLLVTLLGSTHRVLEFEMAPARQSPRHSAFPMPRLSPTGLQFQWLNNGLILGASLFTVGLVGFMAKRSLVPITLSVGVMGQGTVIALVGGSAFHRDFGGRTLAVGLVLLVAVQLVLGGLLTMALLRRGESLDLSTWDRLHDPALANAEDEPVVHVETVAVTVTGQRSS